MWRERGVNRIGAPNTFHIHLLLMALAWHSKARQATELLPFIGFIRTVCVSDFSFPFFFFSCPHLRTNVSCVKRNMKRRDCEILCFISDLSLLWYSLMSFVVFLWRPLDNVCVLCVCMPRCYRIHFKKHATMPKLNVCIWNITKEQQKKWNYFSF